MNITISGRHMSVTEPIREYVTSKLPRVGRLLDSEEFGVDVVVSHDRNPSIPNHNHIEITGVFRGFTVRVEEAAPDMYEAIDLAVERFESQLRTLKSRLISRRHPRGTAAMPVGVAFGAVEESIGTADGSEAVEGATGADKEIGPLGTVVRHKSVPEAAMSQDEAILQLEMLGHDFFVFRHIDSGDTAVVYRRDAGDYGMIRMGQGPLTEVGA